MVCKPCHRKFQQFKCRPQASRFWIFASPRADIRIAGVVRVVRPKAAANPSHSPEGDTSFDPLFVSAPAFGWWCLWVRWLTPPAVYVSASALEDRSTQSECHRALATVPTLTTEQRIVFGSNIPSLTALNLRADFQRFPLRHGSIKCRYGFDSLLHRPTGTSNQ